jgi:tetratricopeptide (TPR) repeat protein
MSTFTRAMYVLFALSSAPLAAHAQDAAPEATGEDEAPAPAADENEARAREHFQKGVAYYSEGDLGAALVELKRAYELQPTFRLLYNLGQVSYELRDYAGAEAYFRDYLAQGGAEIETERRVEVELELERLKGRVADVMVRTDIADAQLFVDDREVGLAPLTKPLRLSAGRRTVRAELPGRPPVQRVIEVVGGESMNVELQLGASPVATGMSVDVDGDDGFMSKPAFWTGVATGVLALGAGGMALWTSSEQADYDDAIERRTSRSELNDRSDSVEQKALITDILLGATVVGAAVTVVLILTDDDSEEREPSYSSFEVGPGSVRGTF